MEEKFLYYGVKENVFWMSLSCLRKRLTERLVRLNIIRHIGTAFVEKKNACLNGIEKSVC